MKSSSKFPEKHTEEEELLLQNYGFLKKLRKQLMELRSRQAAESETSRDKEETPVKPSEDARVAAERLVKSGKIKIQSACQPRVLMKKGRDSFAPAAAYRPYSPTSSLQQPDDLQQPQAKRPRANLYDSFVSAGIQEPASVPAAAATGEPARRGNTLFVQGYNIYEDMLRAAFSPFGAISRVSMETRGRFNDAKNNKPKAFVTFESEDDAAVALEQLDGQLVKGSVLSVRLARKQPSGPMYRTRGAPDWGDGGGGGSGKRRGGLGYDAVPAGEDAGGSAGSPRYAPPTAADETAPSGDYETTAATAGASATPNADFAAASSADESDVMEQRRPLEYSDGVFVSSDPMEEDAVVELEEVM